MNEKMFHSLNGVGAAGVVVGVICIVSGITLGVISIISGAQALGLKKHIIF